MERTIFTTTTSTSSSTPLPFRTTSSSNPIRASQFPRKLKLSRLKRSSSLGYNRNCRPVVTNACGTGENGSGNGFSINPIKIFTEEAIGAEYGEGFETFRSDGPLKVDVDFLNERLQEGFLKRIRYAMKPDEAYGLVFSWDNVVSDTQTLKLKAWKQLASEEGKEIPGDGDAQRLLLYAGADHVLHKILLWEKEESELDRLKSRLSQLYYENLLKFSEPMDGLHQWLDAVYRSHIPCAVVSSLDRINMVEALERMGLRKYFQVGILLASRLDLHPP